MFNAYEHPDITRALRTGYGYDTDVTYEDEGTFYYSPDVGEMDRDEALSYMLDYCRENFSDAVEMFGFVVKTRSGDW